MVFQSKVMEYFYTMLDQLFWGHFQNSQGNILVFLIKF